MNDGKTITAKTVGGENLVQPLMGCTIFGEEDDATIVPLAAGLEIASDPLDDRLGLGVRLMASPLCPMAHLCEQAPLFIG